MAENGPAAAAFAAPGRYIQGRGAIYRVGEVLEQLGSSKPLIDNGDLVQSVGYRFVQKDVIFVGVNRKKEGGIDIAAIHEREKGTKIKVTPRMRAYLHARGLHLKPTTKFIFIPGRPFLKPAFRDFKDKGIVKEFFREAVAKTLKGD